MQPVKPALELLFRANVDVGAPINVSQVSQGERRYIAITGGSFKGPSLSGEILSGGADWQLIKPDGTAFLHARYSLRTVDNALIYVENKGIRRGDPEVLAQLARGETVDPSHYYFRTVPTFETGAPKYAWLNDTIAVCSGMRLANAVIVDFYAVR